MAHKVIAEIETVNWKYMYTFTLGHAPDGAKTAIDAVFVLHPYLDVVWILGFIQCNTS